MKLFGYFIKEKIYFVFAYVIETRVFLFLKYQSFLLSVFSLLKFSFLWGKVVKFQGRGVDKKVLLQLEEVVAFPTVLEEMVRLDLDH